MSRSRSGPEPQIRASRRLIQVTEWELQQILLDIHDGPVQHMYAALSQLNLVRRALRTGAARSESSCTEVERRLEQVRLLLKAGLADIRTFIGAYRTPEFEGRGVGELLEGLALQHEALTDTRVTVRAEEWPDGAPGGQPLAIEIDGTIGDALALELQDALWDAMPRVRHLRPEAIGHFVEKTSVRRSNALALTQLLVTYYLVQAVEAARSEGAAAAVAAV